MAYNDDLALRVSAVTNDWNGIVEKKCLVGLVIY